MWRLARVYVYSYSGSTVTLSSPVQLMVALVGLSHLLPSASTTVSVAATAHQQLVSTTAPSPKMHLRGSRQKQGGEQRVECGVGLMSSGMDERSARRASG